MASCCCKSKTTHWLPCRLLPLRTWNYSWSCSSSNGPQPQFRKCSFQLQCRAASAENFAASQKVFAVCSEPFLGQWRLSMRSEVLAIVQAGEQHGPSCEGATCFPVSCTSK